MTTVKNLGIWLDHSSAHLMEFISWPIETNSIESNFPHILKEHDLGHSKEMMHKKEQQQSAYYKALCRVIKNYKEILLFGPIDATNELFNLLKLARRFTKLKIEIRQTEKLTENQQHAFVRKYFSTR